MGRTPIWGLWTVGGRFLRFYGSRTEIETDYSRLVWRRKTARFTLKSLRNHSLAMRRDQLKSADNKPLPKNRESSMTLLDDLKLLTDQALAVRDRHPENRTLSIVTMMLVSAITVMLADLRRQSLPQVKRLRRKGMH